MKTVLHYIFEASGKPSDIKKYTNKNTEKEIRYSSGDIYDFKDKGRDEVMQYVKRDGTGFIKDKQGNTYEVETHEQQEDAGSFAKGGWRYQVIIKKANGTDDFVVDGYEAVMTKSVNKTCIEDIENGYYLEDYIAKYITDKQQDKFGEIAGQGDKNAKSFKGTKADKQVNSYNEFFVTHVVVPQNVIWEINDSGLQFPEWSPGRKTKEFEKNRKEADVHMGKNNELYDELRKKNEELAKAFDKVVHDAFRPVVEKMLQKVFKTKDINELKGLSGLICYDEVSGKWDRGNTLDGSNIYALNLKTKKMVKAVLSMNTKRCKIVDHDTPMYVNDTISLNKKHMTAKVEKLFKTVAKAWKKTQATGKHQAEYIEKNWQRIRAERNAEWSMNMKDAKALAKEEWKEVVMKHDFESNDKLRFSLALIQLYVEGDFDPDQEPIEKPLENPEATGAKKSGKTNAAAYQKIQDWHDGKRKQNVANCSDAKLKMNYKICKELGFDKEMDELKKEADKRGILLESISLAEMVKAISESED